MEISNRDLKWLTLLTRGGVVTKKLDEIGKFYPIFKNYPRKKDNLDFENSSSIDPPSLSRDCRNRSLFNSLPVRRRTLNKREIEFRG